ncbi:MAG TPA: PPC domain-containing protein, partial [Kofleriaceae bacterium]|nr:PPC domain-containing protein [Kofleriaceae bacterium]
MVFALAFAFAAVGWVGCTISSDYAGTAYTCTDGRCPPGFSCVEARCVDGDGGPDDAAGADDAMVDAPTCTCEPRSNTCLPADLEELTGAAQAGGQTVCGSTTDNTGTLAGCTNLVEPLPGRDAVFRFSATAGQQITATLRPLDFDGAVYLLTDCGDQCLVVANDQGVGGTEVAAVAAPATGDYYVVVDSPSGSGCYELTVAVESKNRIDPRGSIRFGFAIRRG